MADEWRRKLDARGRYQLEEGRDTGVVELLLRTTGPPTADELARLEAAGFEPWMPVSGSIMSGRVSDPAALERVARLAFVEAIELSRPLREEDDEHHAERGDGRGHA